MGLPTLVTEYPYRDAQGQLLYVVERRAPKVFRQRAPAPGGKWRWSLNGIERVLYRLPELLQSDPEADVYLCEGEKDADRLAGLGLTATTIAGGAAAPWRPEYLGPFKARTVVILADADEAGRRCAQKRATEISTVAKAVKVLELPGLTEHGDVSDWLDTSGSLQDLTSIVYRTSPWIAAQSNGAASVTSHEVDPPDGSQRSPHQATELVRLAHAKFRIGRTRAGEPFAVAIAGPNVARMLRGGNESLRHQLAAIFNLTRGRVPSSSALADALNVLEGEAVQSPQEPVHLRLARDGANVVLDLGSSGGQAVVVRPDGWSVLEVSPVLFRRTELTGPVSTPEAGSEIEELRSFLNISDTSWDLTLGWLVAALIPEIPHPILLLKGEQGTAKSWGARILAMLVDPSGAPLRTPPRDVEQWSMVASGSWIVALDNVSSVPQWLSDALCRAVTGDGLIKRRLYENDALHVVAFRRAIILTSIDPGAVRGDLGERLLPVELDIIPPNQRRLDVELQTDFEEARPRLLGALLTLCSHVLQALPAITLHEYPRMADFARVLAALDEIRGTGSLAAYKLVGKTVAADVVEGDPVAHALQLFIEQERQWSGTAGGLLELLTPDRPPRAWPSDSRQFGGRLKRLAPGLRSVGIEVDWKRSNRTRLLDVRLTEHTGSSNGPSRAPLAPCVTCRVLDWKLDADRWVCANCGQAEQGSA